MQPMTPRRGTAVLAAAALLASLTVVTAAAPATAAKPKCGGKVATIVSWKRVIAGTKKADVIVARGKKNNVIRGRGGRDRICAGRGNDKVYGGGSHDRLFGQGGNDRLFGQGGNDLLHGGLGDDECHQGKGSGKRISCEKPALKPKVLAIAYSDMDGNHRFGAGDVMISQLVDTNGDGIPSPGDTVVMGRYPTKLNPSSALDFETWGFKNHVVKKVNFATATGLQTFAVSDAKHTWFLFRPDSPLEEFADTFEGSPGHVSGFWDRKDQPGDDDGIVTDKGSPSQPPGTHDDRAPGVGDDKHIDVELY